MSLADDLTASMKDAMRAKETLALDTIRMAKSALKNKEIEKMAPVTEAEGFAVLQTLVKQRQEAAGQYRSGNREDLAKKEEAEIEILRRFLPQALSDGELQAIIKETIAEIGATDIKQMGLVIKAVMPQIAGRADGARVSAAVKAALGG